MRRRRWLLAGTALVAGLAGAGLAWRNSRTASLGAIDIEGKTQAATSLEQFWALQFDTPAGQPLAMASLRGKLLLLNFWATWCPPCVEELPLIDRFYQENSKNGWQVLGLAVDQPGPVNVFLGKTPVRFPVALAGLAGVGLSKSLGNLSGGLPFSVVLGADGMVLHRKIGRVTPDDLHAWGTLK